MKTGLKTIGIFISIMVLIAGIKIVFFPAHVLNKTIDTAYQITDKTLDADNVLQNYEWFKQQYQDAVALSNTIEQTKTQIVEYKQELPIDRVKWSEADKNELDRLSTTLAGQKQMFNGIVSQYNAKSQMQNRALFKTKDLPYQLDYQN